MAMITSSEIKNAAFEHTTFRGYNPEQVDRVLDNAAETVDTLTRDNAILNEKIRALSNQVEELRAREGSLNEIMIRAQKMSDDMLADSKAKSEAMIAEAERKSEELLSSARALGESKIAEYKEAIAQEKARLASAREEAAGFIDMICGELTAHTEMIAKIKTRARIEDVEPRLYVPAADLPEPEERSGDTSPAAVDAVSSAEELSDELSLPQAAAGTVDEPPAAEAAPAPAKEIAFAPSPAPAAPDAHSFAMADEIAGRILQSSAPAAPASTAGMSWDEIIGLKTGSTPTPKTETPDASSLKFGKEFDVTIQ